MISQCLFCGGDASAPNHAERCDGRQGVIEAAATSVPMRFDGETYVHERDGGRLARQMGRVLMLMRDGEWHTLPEIAAKTDDPPASVSARLRDLRKTRFGGHVVERIYVERGLFAYRLVGS